MRAAPATRAGYTLVELMLTVAITGTLAAIAIPNYRGYVERARVASCVSDIRNIATEIDGFEVDRGRLPTDLTEIGYDTWKDPWGNLYAYLPLQPPPAMGLAAARKDRFLVPINSDYDLYSRGADGLTAAPLTAMQSQDDVIRASNGSFIGLASSF
jgi:general secretion pathway protein G